MDTKLKDQLFHLSEKNLEGQNLLPRIPNNFMVDNGYENAETPRISFSKSIDGALIGLSSNLEGKELFVHEPRDYNLLRLQVPTVKDVPDSHLTNEVWSLEPTKLKMIKRIKVGKSVEDELPYEYGDGLKASLYKWQWTEK